MTWPVLKALSLLVVVLGSSAAANAQNPGQRHPGEWAWKPVVSKDGLQVSYIHYSKADSKHDGVVVRLVNTLAVPAAYSFQIVFKSQDSEQSYDVGGELEGGEMRTGDADGLFFIPFEEGQEIDVITLRKWRFGPDA